MINMKMKLIDKILQEKKELMNILRIFKFKIDQKKTCFSIKDKLIVIKITFLNYKIKKKNNFLRNKEMDLIKQKAKIFLFKYNNNNNNKILCINNFKAK